MTPLIGFRTDKTTETTSPLMGIGPAAAVTDAASVKLPSRGADYAYRIAALTAGLILLATVM